jgi:hypothetical protein
VRVLIIPEDSRRDKGLLKPLVEAMMSAAGRPRAKVRVCEKPVLGGVAEALKLDRLREIIDLWGGQTDLFCSSSTGTARMERASLPSAISLLGRTKIDVRCSHGWNKRASLCCPRERF